MNPPTEAIERTVPRDPALLGPAAVELIAREVPPSVIASLIKDMTEAVLVSGSIAKAMAKSGADAPPDWRAREAGAKLWLAYVVGQPIQRQHIVQEKRTSKGTALADLATPAARDALRAMLDAADAEAMSQARPAKVPAEG